MGTFIYIKGKMDGKLYGLKILNKYITVSSPRTGILQIGPGLFHAKSQINSQSIGTSANRLNRLQSLIHEARHSDGHAYYLGFLHAVCPIGHTLENLTACDRNRNGPYTLGATFLREFVKDCSSCNENSKEQLRLRYLESFSRVIKTYKKSSLSRSEELELEFLQQRLQLNQLILTKAEVPDKQVILQRIAQFKKRIDELNAKNQNSPTIETVRWPDAPEGRRQ